MPKIRFYVTRSRWQCNTATFRLLRNAAFLYSTVQDME